MTWQRSSFVNMPTSKGHPNMTLAAFCLWVKDDLFPNVTLEPGYPRRISVETARKWFHHPGFKVLSPSKGCTLTDTKERMLS